MCLVHNVLNTADFVSMQNKQGLDLKKNEGRVQFLLIQFICIEHITFVEILEIFQGWGQSMSHIYLTAT